MVYVSTTEAARLMSVTDRTLRNHISSNRLQAERDGNGYKIPLNQLPARVQELYLNTHHIPANVDNALDSLAPTAQLKAQAATHSIGVQAIVSQNKKQERNIAIYYRAKRKPIGMTTKEWYTSLSGLYGVSVATIYRIVKDYNTNGFSKPKKDKKSSWSPEAVDYMRAHYLKAIREIGACTKQNAYNVVKYKADIEGWEIGSRTSAYTLLGEINPLVIRYAMGGNLALDNTFWILRNYDNLQPFQVIVGDQHIIDQWVTDKDGNVFRPQCYLWIDIKTRMPYGIDFARKYNSETVKNSLYMGLCQWGKFGSTYNDNGKPEISKFIDQIVGDVQKLGMECADISDLYRTTHGDYIVTDGDDNLVNVVADKRTWEYENRRIFAGVKNAKAKPIEPFFKTLEQILTDMSLPGRVKPLVASAPVEEMHKKRLKKHQQHLLSFEEMQLNVINALVAYMQRKHSRLGCSPIEKLMESVNEGWRPVYVEQAELDLIFLRRAKRRVTNGRVLINNILYQGESLTSDAKPLSQGLWHLDGKKVEVRYSDLDPDKAIAILPDGDIRPLYVVPEYQMLDAVQLEEAIRWKRESMRVIREQWKQSTRAIGGTTLHTTQTKRIEEVQKVQEETAPKYSDEALLAEVEKLKEATEDFINPELAVEPEYWDSKSERYEYYIEKELQSKSLTATEKTFMKTYAESMSEDEEAYWKAYKNLGGNQC